MAITSALVLFAVIWFMVLFISLPLRLTTQEESGEIVDGTHAGAPAHFDVKRKLFWVTVITVVLWAIVAGIILSGWISVRDLDFFNRMSPPASGTGG